MITFFIQKFSANWILFKGEFLTFLDHEVHEDETRLSEATEDLPKLHIFKPPQVLSRLPFKPPQALSRLPITAPLNLSQVESRKRTIFDLMGPLHSKIPRLKRNIFIPYI